MQEKFKKTRNHVIVLKKVYRLIKFNQNAWLKPTIDMKTDLRKKGQKNDFEKNFFQLKINLAFGNLW